MNGEMEATTQDQGETLYFPLSLIDIFFFLIIEQISLMKPKN